MQSNWRRKGCLDFLIFLKKEENFKALTHALPHPQQTKNQGAQLISEALL